MFQEFPKIPRLKREVVLTEKLDGTNACVIITDDGQVLAQSRTRIITPESDNYGFARWVQENAEELKKLGPGYHFGEWWGQGIQRRYGLEEKRFSLFNAGRWLEAYKARVAGHENSFPKCCHVVPVIYQGQGFDGVDTALELLRTGGSIAAPGFMQPEGVVVYHAASRHLYKVLLENDQQPKGQAA